MENIQQTRSPHRTEHLNESLVTPDEGFGGPVAVAQRMWQQHPPLALVGGVTALLTVFFVLGIFVDSRTVLGQPTWLKPAKFAVSTALYCLTLTWLLGFVRTASRFLKRVITAVGWVIAAVFVVEIPLIAYQAARATLSHFNFATTFDATLYSVMGVSIMVLFIANILLAIVLAFSRFDSRTLGWSIRLGLIIAIAGMGEGFLMTNPTALQLAAWEGGAPTTVIGAHSVGVPDGGPAMPVTGWSTTGGDLRIGHFIGMHALQVLPFLGFWLSRRRRLNETQQVALVTLAGVSYFSLTLLVTWQALRAQPLLNPDVLTAGAFLALVAVTGSIALLIVARPSKLVAQPSGVGRG